ncbi:MAG: TlpA family protein disulfide reductase [Propionibacteriaceae bacterium]
MTSSRTPARARSVVPLLLVLALVGLTGCSGSSSRPQDSGGGFVTGNNLTQVAPADRVPAPELTGPRLGSDQPLSSTAYAGQVLVVNVWGSWCAPCRAEAKGLQAASEQTKGVAQFLGINSRDADPAPAEAFVRVQKVTYPSLYDPNGTQLVKFAELPPNAIPSTVIIDKQGRIAARVVGTISPTSLVDLIDDVAAGK